jgi:hypothetical protein
MKALPDIETSNGTTIIRGDYLRKLPIKQLKLNQRYG